MAHLAERTLTELQCSPACLDGNILGQEHSPAYSRREDQCFREYSDQSAGTAEVAHAELILADGSVALVDAEDYPWLSQYVWRKNNNGKGKIYIRRSEGGKTIRLHREIMRASKGQIVDHINGNTLDNRRANLRITDARGNARNRSKGAYRNGRSTSSLYKGVDWVKSRSKYRARITGENGEQIFLGYYTDPIDAARAYDMKAIELYEEYANTNFDCAGEDHAELARKELAGVRDRIAA